MITRTSMNRRVLEKLTSAMRVAAYNARLWTAANGGWDAKGVAYVENARNQPVIRVDYSRGAAGAFQFYDKKQRNITAMVLGALREADSGS